MDSSSLRLIVLSRGFVYVLSLLITLDFDSFKDCVEILILFIIFESYNHGHWTDSGRGEKCVGSQIGKNYVDHSSTINFPDFYSSTLALV